MPRHGLDQLGGLIGAATGKPLLRPATGSRAALDAATPRLGRDKGGTVGQPHGIPASAHEDQADGVPRPFLGRDHLVTGRGAQLVPVCGGRQRPPTAKGDLVGPPWGEGRRRDLLSARGRQRLNPNARNCSRPSSVILSGPHGGIHTQLMR